MVAGFGAVIEILCRETCPICLVDHPASQGVYCEAEQHFVCKGCFSGDIINRQAPEMTAQQQDVKCCQPGCTSRPFPYQVR